MALLFLLRATMCSSSERVVDEVDGGDGRVLVVAVQSDGEDFGGSSRSRSA